MCSGWVVTQRLATKLFPNCQVRVVRFYRNLSLAPLLISASFASLSSTCRHRPGHRRGRRPRRRRGSRGCGRSGVLLALILVVLVVTVVVLVLVVVVGAAFLCLFFSFWFLSSSSSSSTRLFSPSLSLSLFLSSLLSFFSFSALSSCRRPLCEHPRRVRPGLSRGGPPPPPPPGHRHDVIDRPGFIDNPGGAASRRPQS